jgi:hypothetical protein
MNRGLHYRTRRQKRVAHHAHGCGLHGQPGYCRHNNRGPKTEKIGVREEKKSEKKIAGEKKAKREIAISFVFEKIV